MSDEQQTPADDSEPDGGDEAVDLSAEEDADEGSIIWLVVALVLLVGIGAGGYWFFSQGGEGSTGGGGDRPPACDNLRPEDAPYEDGLAQQGERTEILTLQSMRGGPPLEFVMDDAVRPCLDIAHAESHTALGQQTRVYYEEQGGEKHILFMEDAPTSF